MTIFCCRYEAWRLVLNLGGLDDLPVRDREVADGPPRVDIGAEPPQEIAGTAIDTVSG